MPERVGAARLGVAALAVLLVATVPELMLTGLLVVEGGLSEKGAGTLLVVVIAPVVEEAGKALALRLFAGQRRDWGRDWPRLGVAFGMLEGGGKLLGMAVGGTMAVALLFGALASALMHGAFGRLAGRLAARSGPWPAMVAAMLAHAAVNGAALLPAQLDRELLRGVPLALAALLASTTTALLVLLLGSLLARPTPPPAAAVPPA